MSAAQFADPNVVKAVLGVDGRALYFSRAPVPWDRDARAGVAAPVSRDIGLRHVGLYAYRVGALRSITQLPPGRLELIEKLEQLRALENGFVIVAAMSEQPPAPGIDTEADWREAHARALAEAIDPRVDKPGE
jgi:3-deoxy-manno-octulosonate cytidylyltransferase (CMP-KDO synthetase)